MVLRSRILVSVVLLCLLSSLFASQIIANAEELQTGEPVVIFSLSGHITGATTLAIQELLSVAESLNARLILIELSTTGGELGAVLNIMQLFTTSPIPIMVYIPTASQGISGGTYLLQAAHIAAMGLASQIGACQPIAGIFPITDPAYLNNLVSLMTSQAHLHERNTTTGSRFILENLIIGPTQALATESVELVDGSIPELLTSLEAYTLVQRELQPNDLTYRLIPTADLGSFNYSQIVEDFANIASESRYYYTPNTGLTILSFLSHPVISFLLLQIGIWGFIFALNAPGHMGEIISIVCIVLGLVGLGIIGISLAGIVLMAFGVALLLIEAKTEISFAGLAAGFGVACFVLGGIFFLPPSQWLVPSQIMWLFQGASAAIALSFSALFGFAIIKAAQARRLTSDFDPRLMPGAPGVAETLLDPEGRVRAFGESWMAKVEKGVVKAGESVEVVRLDGIRLIVKRLETPPED
ncbi:MAG: nodulation protein NfeD [Candidatus Hodarchaeota archaeon]